MNRYVSFPMIIALLVFVAVLRDYTEPATNLGSAARGGTHSVGLDNRLIPFEEAERAILEGWPTMDIRETFSRRVYPQPLVAAVHRPASGIQDGIEPYFLCSLAINTSHPIEPQTVAGNIPAQKAVPKPSTANAIPSTSDPNRFPVHVDRLSGTIQIFADGRWQNYPRWRDIQLPKVTKQVGLTG